MPKAAADTQMFSADVVAACLMASGVTSLSNKHYELMSALDGTRTASSFQHTFRAVLAKSKELKTRIDAGETFTPVPPGNKRSNGSNPVTPKKRKGSDDGDDTPPSKKKTVKPKARAAKVIQTQEETDEPSNDLGMSGDELQKMDTFIKREQEWEFDHSFI